MMQQESRPLLSPSIDDFLSETRSDAPPHGPPTSNTAVLSTALDLVDLSEPGGPVVVLLPRRSPLRRKAVSRSPRRRADPEVTELIQVEVEQTEEIMRTPERVSLDSVNICTPLDKWEELNPHPER
ncbi:PEX5-related protein-like, partial [Trematomus bernacchii]|uniref:PEX5-related protein-like n=1 Tax=Trematomus bernacchii TaxID=40690 RepID=UPI00146C1FC1